jgi:uncharacterized protein YqgV (UPF0045/DUF77 family)
MIYVTVAEVRPGAAGAESRERLMRDSLEFSPRLSGLTEGNHHMLVAFSVAPSGDPANGQAPGDASVHDAVAAAVRIVRESGLPNRTSSMFTEIEGDWDEVMDVVKRATDAVGAYGSRVSLVLKADIRPGYSGELTGKVERLENAIDGQGAGGTGPQIPTRPGN